MCGDKAYLLLLQLAQSSDKAHTGLSLMLAASEELATPKSDLLSTSRRRELHSLMLQQVPAFLSTIINTLKTSFSFVSPTKISSTPSSHIVTVCQAALRCLNHLFSWIPLSNLITPEILDTVFLYAGLGCCSDNDLSNCLGCLGSEAMDCVNELLVKNCVPREFEAFLMKLFDQSFRLLQQLMGDDTQYLCDFSRLDDRYKIINTFTYATICCIFTGILLNVGIFSTGSFLHISRGWSSIRIFPFSSSSFSSPSTP